MLRHCLPLLLTVFCFLSLLPDFAAAQGLITGLTLIDAATDQEIGPLGNGGVINLNSFPSNEFNVRAETSGAIGSVVFGLDADNVFRKENEAPYTLGGDLNGDYFSLAFSPGLHTITATPYSGSKGSGAAGTPLIIQFAVTSSSLTLSPLSHNFGAVELGSSESVSFSLANVGGAGSGAFLEENGVVAIEVESEPITNGWSELNSLSGFTGSSYYQWTASNSFGNGGSGTLVYRFQIQEAGNFEFRWRSFIAQGTSGTDHNDSWVQFPTGQDIAGEEPLNNEWIKVYQNQKNRWSWQAKTVDNAGRPVRQFFTPGTHEVRISGRSQGHAIDRLVLYRYGAVSFDETAFTNFPESARSGGSGGQAFNIQSISVSGANAADFSKTGGNGSFSLAAGQNAQFSIEFSPTAVGTRSAQVVVVSDSPTSPDIALLEGEGVSSGSSGLSITPSAHDFGAVTVGQAAAQTLSVAFTNSGGTAIDVSALSMQGANAADFSFSQSLPFSVPAGGSEEVAITFTPSAVGPRTAEFVISSSSIASPQTVNLSGTGEAAVAGQSITSLVLVNADTDQDIGVITNGAVFNLAALGNPALNIRAETNPGTVGSVAFSLSGTVNYNHTEGAAPYALFLDLSGDYQPGNLPVGSYTLTATPFTEKKAGGDAGIPLTVNFTLTEQGGAPGLAVTPSAIDFGSITVGQTSAEVQIELENIGSDTITIDSLQFTGSHAVDFSTTAAAPISIPSGATQTVGISFTPSAAGTRTAVLSLQSNASGSPHAVSLSGTGETVAGGQSVTSLILVNADTDQDIGVITNGAVFDLALLGNPALNIRAETNPPTVGSVAFSLSGTVNYNHTEGAAPYALFLDLNGDYQPGNLPVGSYSLTAVPYTGKKAGGEEGTPLNVSFTISEGGASTGLTVTPAALSFGSVNIGQVSAPENVLLKNNGTSTITINNLALSGANSGDFSVSQTLPLSVPAGQSGSLSVTFAPTAQGLRSAVLSIASDAADSPHIVSLTGSGSATTGSTIVSLTLVDADTNEDIRNINSKEVILLSELPTASLNIRANTNPPTVGSVVFDFDGVTGFRTETGAPYALFGDNNGNYFPGQIGLGAHTLTATPYTGPNGSGEAGMPLTVTFTISDMQLSNIARVNAGGPVYTDGSGNTWDASVNFVKKGTLSSFKTTEPIAESEDDTLYQTEVFGTFAYEQIVPNGTYTVTLHFAELFWTEAGQRVFDVVAEGSLVLEDYDIVADVGPLTAVTKSFAVDVFDGVLTIDFIPSVDFAKLSAISIDGESGEVAVQFNQRIIANKNTPGAGNFTNPTSLQLGSDGRLYVAQQNGLIHIFTLDNDKNVTDVQVINTIFNQPTFNEDGAPSGCPAAVGRQVTGMFVDNALNIYVAHSDPRIGTNNSTTSLCIDTDGGILTKLSAPNYSVPQNLVIGLGRSRENHSPNGLLIGPDGWLYLSVGGNTNYGAPSTFFSNLPETNATAVVTRLNLNASFSAPINAAAGAVVGSGPGDGEIPGVYEVYADGYRNGYDMLWHSNGKLYLNTNEGNGGLGNTPGPLHGCPNAVSLNPGTLPDKLFIVTQGAYGGHPHPARGKCVYGDGTIYNPDLTPEPAYTPPIHEYLGSISTNGLAEYNSTAFNGRLLGDIITVSTFSNDEVRRLKLNASGTEVVEETILASNLAGPIDVWVHADGSIFVAQFGSQSGSGGDTILLLEPTVPGTPGDNDGDGIPDAIDPDDDNDGYSDADEIANGTDPFNPASFPPDFDGDFISDLLDPDDDNDGIDDDVDPFVFDAFNGANTVPPVFFEYNPGDEFLGMLRNTGFTGVQLSSNGSGFIPGNINTGAAGGFMVINPTAGDMKGAANDQDNALQIGVNASPVTGIGTFTIHARVVDPFVSPPAPPVGAESAGIFISLGEDDFIRLVISGDTGTGTSGIQFSGEIAGSHVENLTTPEPLSVGGSQNIDLFLTVDPNAGTVSAGYRIDSELPEAIQVLGTVNNSSLPGLSDFFTEGLGVGVTATKAGESSSSFVAVFDFFRLLVGSMKPAGASDAVAVVTVDPGGNINNSSTYTSNSILITNQSPSGQQIERVRIDLRPAVLPDQLWDPDGTAGDPVGKPFTPDSGAAETGLTGHAHFAFRDGGYGVLDVSFSDFDQGETFGFSIDADPSSIKGADDPGPSGSGSLSGVEMSGSTITVFFNDGSVLSNSLFAIPGSVTGSTSVVRANAPTAPGLSILGTPLLTFNTGTANQTVRVTGDIGGTVRLLVLEAALHLTGVPNGGFDIDPFEANKVVKIVSDTDAVIGSDGYADIPVLLEKTNSEGGINHIIAVQKDANGLTGMTSVKAVIDFN